MDKIVPKDNPGGGEFPNNETRSLWDSPSMGNSNNSNGNGFHSASDIKETPLFPLPLPKDNFNFGNSPLQQTYSSPTTSVNFGSSPLYHSYKSPASNIRDLADSPFSMQTDSFGSPLDNKSSPQSFNMTSQPHERLASDFASIGLHTTMTSQHKNDHVNGCSSSSSRLFTAPMATTSPTSLARPNEKLIRSMSTGSKPKSSSRKNAWGNSSYAELICKAIESSPEKRLTLAQVYDYMVKNIDFFRDKGDSNSSAGWKNSIRHNLSLHSKFKRVQNEGTGKSSWWTINYDAKNSRPARPRQKPQRVGGEIQRSNTMDSALLGSKKGSKKEGRIRKKPQAEKTKKTKQEQARLLLTTSSVNDLYKPYRDRTASNVSLVTPVSPNYYLGHKDTMDTSEDQNNHIALNNQILVGKKTSSDFEDGFTARSSSNLSYEASIPPIYDSFTDERSRNNPTASSANLVTLLQTPLSPTKPNINDDFLNQQSYREDLINQSNYRSRSNTLPQRLDLQPKHNFNIQAQVGMVQKPTGCNQANSSSMEYVVQPNTQPQSPSIIHKLLCKQHTAQLQYNGDAHQTYYTNNCINNVNGGNMSQINRSNSLSLQKNNFEHRQQYNNNRIGFQYLNSNLTNQLPSIQQNKELNLSATHERFVEDFDDIQIGPTDVNSGDIDSLDVNSLFDFSKNEEQVDIYLNGFQQPSSPMTSQPPPSYYENHYDPTQQYFNTAVSQQRQNRDFSTSKTSNENFSNGKLNIMSPPKHNAVTSYDM